MAYLSPPPPLLLTPSAFPPATPAAHSNHIPALSCPADGGRGRGRRGAAGLALVVAGGVCACDGGRGGGAGGVGVGWVGGLSWVTRVVANVWGVFSGPVPAVV